ncbi:MAG: GTP 3',8-cyclase MoaA [Bacteroidia bacterium]|nr:GTP 3',8-cyclase MoaA [Bacteroidia bacterium]
MRPSLIDGHHRKHTYLRIAVTERCNLRCTYCMPADGLSLQPREHMLTTEEIVRVARVAVDAGVTKIRLTGGEPLVRSDLPEIVRRLRALPGLRQLGMTTNGTLLARSADVLCDAGLDAVNISLDTLRPERFARITRRDDHSAVMAGVAAALRAGFAKVKINMVVMRGVNDDELCDVAELTRERALDIRFIEYMPFDANAWSSGGLMTASEMRECLSREYTLHPAVGDTHAGVARMYRIPGFAGRVGFISAMSEHFCDTCNRLRLTADGSLKPCLFSTSECNIRSLLRSGADDASIAGVMNDALAGKWKAHPGVRQLVDLHNRSMIRIGG